MSRTPLAPLDANTPVVSSEPVKIKVRNPDIQNDDSDLWNLRQRIGHLQVALEETNGYNEKLRAEIQRLSNIEEDLQRQKQINAPLVDQYLRIKEAEEASLF